MIGADVVTDKLPTDVDGFVLGSELPFEEMGLEMFRERLPLEALLVARREVLNGEFPAMDMEVADDEV
jgi:hypothetical protein